MLGLCKDKQINYLEEELKKMRKLLKRIDNFIDRAWRNTCATIFYYFDKRVEEDDIDWLNMHNYIQSQKDKD